jgi:hypothetical protein
VTTINIDVDRLVQDMAAAAATILKTRWPDVKSYAETEFRKIGETIALIAREWARGEITEEQATLLLDMQKGASRSVMITVEGMAVVAAEQAINAAFDSVRRTVNAAIGFALI